MLTQNISDKRINCSTLQPGEFAVGGRILKSQGGERVVEINTRELGGIREGISRIIRYSTEAPTNKYYLIELGTKSGNYTDSQVAEIMIPLFFRPNVWIPRLYVNNIAHRINSDANVRMKFNDEQVEYFRDILKDLLLQQAKSKYGNIVSFFEQEEQLSEFLRLMADVEAGIYTNGEDLNIIRVVIECIFKRLIQMGYLPAYFKPSELNECGKEIKNHKDIPIYVRSGIFMMVGFTNPGCHAEAEAPNKSETVFRPYRLAVEKGELPYLIPSFAYTTLCALDWCNQKYNEWSQNYSE